MESACGGVPCKPGKQSLGFDGRGGPRSRSDWHSRVSAPAGPWCGECRPHRVTGCRPAPRAKLRAGKGTRSRPGCGLLRLLGPPPPATRPPACPARGKNDGRARTPCRRPRTAFPLRLTVIPKDLQRRAIRNLRAMRWERYGMSLGAVWWRCGAVRSRFKAASLGRWCPCPWFSLVFPNRFQFVEAFASVASLDFPVG